MALPTARVLVNGAASVSVVPASPANADERDVWTLLTLLASLDGATIPAADLDEIIWRVARLKGRTQ